MRSMRTVLLIFGCLALAAGPAQAVTVVSINLYNGTNTLAGGPTGDTAGVVPAKYWTNFLSGGSGEKIVTTGVLDSNGGATGFTVKAATGYGSNGPNLVSGTGPNVTMMLGEGLESIYISSIMYRGQIEVSGNVKTYLGGAYDVYVYYGPDYSPGQMGGTGTIVLSGAGTYTPAINNDLPTAVMTVNYRTLNSNGTGSQFTPVYDTNVGFIRSDIGPVNGNYVKFSGVTEETLTLTGNTLTGGSYFRTMNIVGMQIVSLPAPEINVKGGIPWADIVDGDSTPSLADGTDFGTAGHAVTHVFWVQNIGDATLTTSGLTLPTGFTAGADPLAASIPAGQSDTFEVVFNKFGTLANGTYAGDISFTNNDGNETPYNFRVTGTVVPEPAGLGLIGVALLALRKRRA